MYFFVACCGFEPPLEVYETLMQPLHFHALQIYKHFINNKIIFIFFALPPRFELGITD
jgi:hypothetical protein